MRRLKLIAGVAGLTLALTACATVSDSSGTLPDYSASPTYGTVSLSAGFPSDPRVVSLQSGGPIPASNISPSCEGYVARAPDVRLIYHAGELPLILSVASSADTTLVVNSPGGQWYCDDDSGTNGVNPSLRFSRPVSGQYDIWVGTYGGTGTNSARLHISEVSSQ
jgi:hypothetical protein